MKCRRRHQLISVDGIKESRLLDLRRSESKLQPCIKAIMMLKHAYFIFLFELR